jgi:phosphate:Na+ symporter
VASHVIFNILGAIFTLILLTPLLSLITIGQIAFNSNDIALTLSLFHTLFNVLAVLLIWPISNSLITFLSRYFIDKNENKAKPIFLTKQSLSLPSLALHAISKELERTAHFALTMAKESIKSDKSTQNNFELKAVVVRKLVTEIDLYTSRLYQQNLDTNISEKLPVLIRVSQYYVAIAELAVMLDQEKQTIETVIEASIQQQVNQFNQASYALLNQASLNFDTQTFKSLDKQLNQLETDYQALKSLLLRRGAEGSLSIAKMDRTMTIMSYTRRINQQAVKAFEHFSALDLNADKVKENK